MVPFYLSLFKNKIDSMNKVTNYQEIVGSPLVSTANQAVLWTFSHIGQTALVNIRLQKL